MGGLAIGVTGILYVFVSPIVASLILELKEGIRVPCFLKSYVIEYYFSLIKLNDLVIVF